MRNFSLLKKSFLNNQRKGLEMDPIDVHSEAQEKNCAHASHTECLDCPEFEECPERQKRFLEYIVFAILIALLATVTLIL